MNLGSYLGMFEAGDLGAMIVAPRLPSAPSSSSTPSPAVIASYCDPTSEFYSAEFCARYRGASVQTPTTRAFSPASLPAIRTAATNTKAPVPAGAVATASCPACPACPTCPAPTECPTCPPATAAETGGFPWWFLVLAAGAGYYFGRRG